MRIFVYEHITGGGFRDQPLPAALAHEGELMLRALAHDLTDIPGTEVMVLRDIRLAPLPTPVITLPAQSAIDNLFRRCCSMADAVWPIAPESAGTLEQLSRMVIDAGRLLLGCRPDATHLAGSKRATSEALAMAGLPVVQTYRDLVAVPEHVKSIVVKPDDGAGCTDTLLMDRESARQWWATQNHDGYVVQPYLPGEPLSLSLLCREGTAQLLSCNRQRVSVENGRFCFTGVGVNEVRDDSGIYARLAGDVAAAIPGLWGYVGIDLVETDAGPVVIEINPRVTTSYAGLRRALHCNPAALVLGLLQPGPQLDDLSFPTDAVEIEVCDGA